MNELSKKQETWKWKKGKVKNAFVRKNEKANEEDPVVLSLARSGVKIRDITTGEGQLAENYSKYNPVEPGDLLLNPMDLYSGANCSLSNVSGVISPAYINLRAKKNILPKFYDYYFKVQYWSMAFFANGKGVSFDNRWTLNVETLMNYPIPLPSLSEQQKIADFLDEKVKEIDNAIEKTKETIELYKKYKQAIITEAVTKGLDPNVEMKDSGIEWINQIPVKWNVNRLKNLFSFGKGLPITKADLKESGLPVISYGQIHSKTNSGVCVKKELVRFVSQSYYESNSESMTKKGDIIVADTSEDLEGCGNAVYINDDFNIFAGYHTVILKSKENKSNKYIAYLMKTDLWRSQIRTLVTSVKVFSITQSILKQCSVILPPKDSQEEIVDFLDDECSSIDAIVNKMSSLIPAYENYKKSLIYEYVTGKKEVK